MADQIAAMSREIGPEARLPSERSLSATFGVQRGTIQKAIGVLTARGVLKRRPSSGTFVKAASSTAPITLLQFHVSSVEDMAYLTHIRGIQEGIAESGRTLLPSIITTSSPSPEVIIRSLVAAEVAGVIIDRYSVPRDVPMILALHKAFPIVSMSKEFLQAPMPCARIEMTRSTALLVNCLVAHGCRHLLAFGWDSSNLSFVRRCEAFQAAAAALGVSDAQVIWRHVEDCEDLIAGASRPVGILAPLYSEAERALSAARRHGMTLNKDVWIATCPPAFIQDQYEGMVMAVRDEEKLGFEAARLLLRHIEGKAGPTEIVEVPPEMVLP